MTLTAKKSVICIIEDDKPVRESLSVLLRFEGYHVVAFEDAESYLSEDSSTEVGCLIVDVRLPGMSGIDLMELLETKGSECPAILITGHAGGEELSRVNIQRISLLPKPADPQRILELIATTLESEM